MSDSQKPREFWISEGEYDSECGSAPGAFYSCVKHEPFRNSIHVIEFSAYEALMQQARAMIETLELAREIHNLYMQCYGDEGNFPTLDGQIVIAVNNQVKQALEQFDEFIKRTEK